MAIREAMSVDILEDVGFDLGFRSAGIGSFLTDLWAEELKSEFRRASILS